MRREEVDELTAGLVVPALVIESLVSGRIEGTDAAVDRADGALRKQRSVAVSGRRDRRLPPATAAEIKAHHDLQGRWADLKALRNRAQSREHAADANRRLAGAHRKYAKGALLVQEGQALQTAAMIEVAELATASAGLHDRHARQGA